MDVYYHVKFQLCITSVSKVSRVCKIAPLRNRMCSDPHGIGSSFLQIDSLNCIEKFKNGMLTD